MFMGAADAGYDPVRTESWTLSAVLAPGSEARAALVREFTADAGRAGPSGEAALTVEEAEMLLDDPRAQSVYAEKTVSIVAPSMLKRQRQDHLDLMQLFLKPERINAGAEFVKTHRPLLERVEAARGVDLEVIVGILMWETKLGTITGDYRVFNAFISQAFFIDQANAVALARKEEQGKVDPAAQKRRVEAIRTRARKNLVALVRQCKAKGIDPLEQKGSWAGAMGFPQFMPASLRYADDGNGDGRIDLFTFEDAIASIARYLSQHGYRADRTKAVWNYNHEDAYVKGVLAFADALKAKLGRAGDAGALGSTGKSGVTGTAGEPGEARIESAGTERGNSPRPIDGGTSEKSASAQDGGTPTVEGPSSTPAAPKKVPRSAPGASVAPSG